MPHLPNEAIMLLAKGLKAKFDTSKDPLPADLEILLCCLDGAERRQCVQSRLKISGQKQNLDRPADVHWTPADQVLEVGPNRGGNKRHFASLRKAMEFVTQELTIAERANVWITNEDENLTIEQIEKMAAR